MNKELFLFLTCIFFLHFAYSDVTVFVKTGNGTSEGTADMVFIQVYGLYSITHWYVLKNYGSKTLQEGSNETYILPYSHRIGHVCKVQIMKLGNDSWFLDSVAVESDGDYAHIDFGEWILYAVPYLRGRVDPVRLGWSSWSQWTRCSDKCSGTKFRQRLCQNCEDKKFPCPGVNHEYQACSREDCPSTAFVVHITTGNFTSAGTKDDINMQIFSTNTRSEWFPLKNYGPKELMTGSTEKFILPSENKTRHICKVQVQKIGSSDPWYLESINVTNSLGEKAFVSFTRWIDNGTLVIEPRTDSINFGWTKWSEWSECSADCNGTKVRERKCQTCDEVTAPCTGAFRESQACSTTFCNHTSVLTTPINDVAHKITEISTPNTRPAFTVLVKTGNMSKAGTTEDVNIQIFSIHTITHWYSLKGYGAREFKAGSTEQYLLPYKHKVGHICRVQVFKVGTADPWYLESMTVTNRLGETAVVQFDQWIHGGTLVIKHRTDPLILGWTAWSQWTACSADCNGRKFRHRKCENCDLANNPCGGQNHEYKVCSPKCSTTSANISTPAVPVTIEPPAFTVLVKTGSMSKAGTTEDVNIQIFSIHTVTGWYSLKGYGAREFKAGSTEQYLLPYKHKVGHICRVQVLKVGTADPWYLESMTVTNRLGETAVVRFEQWIHGGTLVIKPRIDPLILGWTAWSQWTACSADCNGRKFRHRKCENCDLANNPCGGQNHEYKACSPKCSTITVPTTTKNGVAHKTTEISTPNTRPAFTVLVKTGNISKAGTTDDVNIQIFSIHTITHWFSLKGYGAREFTAGSTEQYLLPYKHKVGHICRVQVHKIGTADPWYLESMTITNRLGETAVVQFDQWIHGGTLVIKPRTDPLILGWTAWSQWTACSADCNGRKFRLRKCENCDLANNPCSGQNHEYKACSPKCSSTTTSQPASPEALTTAAPPTPSQSVSTKSLSTTTTFTSNKTNTNSNTVNQTTTEVSTTLTTGNITYPATNQTMSSATRSSVYFTTSAVKDNGTVSSNISTTTPVFQQNTYSHGQTPGASTGATSSQKYSSESLITRVSSSKHHEHVNNSFNYNKHKKPPSSQNMTLIWMGVGIGAFVLLIVASLVIIVCGLRRTHFFQSNHSQSKTNLWSAIPDRPISFQHSNSNFENPLYDDFNTPTYHPDSNMAVNDKNVKFANPVFRKYPISDHERERVSKEMYLDIDNDRNSMTLAGNDRSTGQQPNNRENNGDYGYDVGYVSLC